MNQFIKIYHSGSRSTLINVDNIVSIACDIQQQNSYITITDINNKIHSIELNKPEIAKEKCNSLEDFLKYGTDRIFHLYKY